MKQFSLEEYLKNPSRKVVTRDGRNVRILCTDRRDADYPIVDLIESTYTEAINFHTKDGKYFLKDTSNCDLFFAPEKREGWVNMFKGNGYYYGGYVFESEEEAKGEGMDDSDYVTTVKIEWEE